ncbi:MAG TPA: YetF domain-containing protein [Noviherbaspirillum sp.]|uniref:DUF421 domain-containing protein n=1 Tax=Noviherbaspirillum sp. TaxID=1926288 RepID=UPI002D327030|nr:YetF domain-containing protein [Noviherbaspirillum sp.]HYD93815.1 YetF domain-containing protein [Noviherbaspirillum sp.]
MELILRTAGIYLFLLVLFRLLGKRSLSELSAFDFILFLIISEAIQNALVDDDKSLVMGLTVILTFLLLDLGLSALKARFNAFEKFAEGVPLLLVDHGKVIEQNMKKSRVTYSDILQTARESQGLERMSQVKYAVLETSGAISIIPQEPDAEEALDSRIRVLDQKLDSVLARLPATDRTAAR